MNVELDFIDFMQCGIKRYLRPLRHCVLDSNQHIAIFQNVEKVGGVAKDGGVEKVGDVKKEGCVYKVNDVKKDGGVLMVSIMEKVGGVEKDGGVE